MSRIITIIVASLLINASPSVAGTVLSMQVAPGEASMILYRNANLTLVEQAQKLSLNKGANRLRFSWAGSSVDPTSLMLTPGGKNATVAGLSFPPGSSGKAIWEIDAVKSGEIDFSLSYFTTGLTASTSYRLVLNDRGDRARLQGSLQILNHSYEPFENIRLSLLVGSVQILDDVAHLAARSDPYGRPSGRDPIAGYLTQSPRAEKKIMMARSAMATMASMAESDAEEPLRLDQAQAVSDYALISIPGSHTFKAAWGHESYMLDAKSVQVVNRYRYDEDRYGNQAIHLLDLINKNESGLGVGPMPDGDYEVLQEDGSGGLFYHATTTLGFIPMDGALELNLGSSDQVQVAIEQVDLKTFDHTFDTRRAIGWRELRAYRINMQNHQSVPADIEIIRRMPGENWIVEHKGFHGSFKKIDQYRGAYRITLPARSTQQFGYTVTSEMGSVGIKQQ